MSFQELFLDGEDDLSKVTGVKKVLTNKYFATAVTLAPGFVLCLGGYNNVWPLFGAANQLLSALVLITLVVFLRATGRKGFMLWVPMLVMMAVTFTALVQATVNLLKKLFVTGNFVFMVDGLQLIIAIMLMALGVIVVLSCAKKLSGTKNVKADKVAEA